MSRKQYNEKLLKTKKSVSETEIRDYLVSLCGNCVKCLMRKTCKFNPNNKINE